MQRRLHAATVVVVALLAAMHAPAVVGQTGDTLVVGSQHTTETDFESGSFSNLTVNGSGQSAVLRLREPIEGSTASRPDSTETYTTTNKYGIEIKPERNLSGVRASIDEQVTGATTAYLFDVSSSTMLDKVQIHNGTITLTGDLTAGESYSVVINAEGNNYDARRLTNHNAPYESQDIDIVGGISGSTLDNSFLYNIKNVTSLTTTPPETASYTSKAHNVSNPKAAAINLTQASDVSINATVRTAGGQVLNQTTLTSPSNHTLVLENTTGEELETELRVNVVGPDPAFELADESILFTNSAPGVDNATATPSGGDVLQPPPTLSLNVSDPQFGTAQGEKLTVEWYVDGNKRGETTATSNGTVSYELNSVVGGDHTWHAVVTDSYGAQTTTQTFDFSAPSELRVYSESNAGQLIDENVSLRVRFFASGTENVIEREVTDGTVDLAGLRADQRYIVTVRANETNEWTYRRIVIDSLIETNSIYLLNESEAHSQIVFELDDPTGQFPPEETTLYVEKPIAKDYDGDGTNETRYQVIAGDIFGASGDFPVILQDEARYRLRVETSDGSSSRILGFYSVSGPATEKLRIQRVAPNPDADAGVSFRAGIEAREDGDYIAIRYQDYSETTLEVEYQVVDGNGTVVVPNTTRGADTFADLYPVPEKYGDDAEFTVNYRIVREGETRSGSVKLGQLSAIAGRFGLDPQILTILSYIAILGTMGLVVINNTRVAPFAGTAVASGLVVVGTVAIPIVVLSVAGVVSILVLVGGGQ